MGDAIERSRAGRLVIFEMLAGLYDRLDIIHITMDDADPEGSPGLKSPLWITVGNSAYFRLIKMLYYIYERPYQKIRHV